MGDKELEGETDDELDVTLDMLGEELSVIVTIDGVEYTDSTLAVTVEGELAILAAEQKGAKTIEATFSEAITALDKLTVSKNGEELKQAYAPKIADDGLSATITLENRITAGTYTVTLTPADDDPSEATFEGEVAALNSIEFVSDYLIMKDNEYKEGYAYIKGVDQFGDDMSLSSVTVIPGYGHFRSYDATTGKITIGVDDDETNFAIVKEVPVFVTYQNGADTIPANATLKVTTMSYVQELTFGDIYKADGSVVDDDTNPLMIGDLKSKPYVEIKDAEDQYGNKLSAKDLNDQATGNTKVLFVIPDESTTSAYYSTGKFSTITEKDGTVKTILYLAAGGDMPGSMDLIITGASGQSFSKPVTVQDDPYIDTLRVNYPTLYEGTDESDALEFTAVDQYGKEIKDLFKFAPKTTDNDSTLVFNDRNHLTGQITKITAPDSVNWVVKKDNINKKFTVTMKLKDDVKKGATLVITAQTAGLKVTPTNLTVGQRTNGESIDTAIGGSLKLDPQNTSFDFNQNVRFLSSNGTVMDRVENEQYPIFLNNRRLINNVTNTAGFTGLKIEKDKPVFFWTVSRDKEGQVTGNKTAGFTIEPSGTAGFDATGEITVNDLDDVVGIVNGDGEYIPHKNGTFYVTLYKASQDNAGDLNVAVIDKQSFKLTYSPTVIEGKWQLGTQYTAEIKENRNLFADADKTDSVTIRVKAYPNVGEPYYVDNTFVKVTGDTDNIKAKKEGNELKVRATKAGSATFSVYVKEPEAKQGVYTTVKVTADDKQTATKVQKDFAATAVAEPTLNSKVGTNFTDSSRTANEWTTNAAQDGTNAVKNTVTIKDGQMTIMNGNRLGEKLTLGIKDQHGLPMKDAKFFVDGLPYEKFWVTTDDGNFGVDKVWTAPVAVVGNEKTGYTYNVAKHIIEVRSADDSIIQHYTIELGVTDWNYTKSAETTKISVDTETRLETALAKAEAATVDKPYEITITEDLKATKAITVPAYTKLIVDEGVKLDTGAQDVTINGELVINGVWTATGTAAAKVTITNNGKVSGDGHATLTYCTIKGANAGDVPAGWIVNGSTLVLNNCTIASGSEQSFGGHVEVEGTLDIKDEITLLAGVTFDLTGSTLTTNSAEKIAVDELESGETVKIITQDEKTIEVTSTGLTVTKEESTTTQTVDAQSDINLPISDGDFIDVAKADAGGLESDKTVEVSLPSNEVSISENKTITKGVDLVVEEGQTLTVESGMKLTIESGATLTVSGTLVNKGVIANNGTLYNLGSMTQDKKLPEDTSKTNDSYSGTGLYIAVGTTQAKDHTALTNAVKSETQAAWNAIGYNRPGYSGTIGNTQKENNNTEVTATRWYVVSYGSDGGFTVAGKYGGKYYDFYATEKGHGVLGVQSCDVADNPEDLDLSKQAWTLATFNKLTEFVVLKGGQNLTNQDLGNESVLARVNLAAVQ